MNVLKVLDCTAYIQHCTMYFHDSHTIKSVTIDSKLKHDMMRNYIH